MVFSADFEVIKAELIRAVTKDAKDILPGTMNAPIPIRSIVHRRPRSVSSEEHLGGAYIF